MRRKPRNHYNVSQPDSSTSQAFARYPLVLGGTVPSLQWEGCVSSFLCSPLFASSLLPRPVQLALVRRSPRLRPRPRSRASPISSGNRRSFVRSWRGTARPPVSGSANSSSATPIASNVIILPTDPLGSQALPWETLGGHLFSPLRLMLDGVAGWLLPLPGSSPVVRVDRAPRV
jgi:hypothetical protein